jgi:hypothetical protein
MNFLEYFLLMEAEEQEKFTNWGGDRNPIVGMTGGSPVNLPNIPLAHWQIAADWLGEHYNVGNSIFQFLGLIRQWYKDIAEANKSEINGKDFHGQEYASVFTSLENHFNEHGEAMYLDIRKMLRNQEAKRRSTFIDRLREYVTSQMDQHWKFNEESLNRLQSIYTNFTGSIRVPPSIQRVRHAQDVVIAELEKMWKRVLPYFEYWGKEAKR